MMNIEIDITAKPELKKQMTLTQLPKGQDARVVAVNGSGSVTRRLMEMGVIPGVGVRL